MLQTYRHLARAEGKDMVNHYRMLKVQQSMARIKSVIHEREIEYLTAVDPVHNRARALKQARSRRLRRMKQTIKNPARVYHPFDITRLKPFKKRQFREIQPRFAEDNDDEAEYAEEHA